MKRQISVVAVAIALLGGAAGESLMAQTDLAGEWEGAIQVGGGAIPMVVEFSDVDGELGATMDIQGAQDLPLINVSRAGDQVHFELQAGLGLAVFDGTVGDGEISGSFEQSGSVGTFDLVPLVPAGEADLSTLNDTERAALGDWEGALQVAGVEIPMTVHFSATGRGFGATADMQGATGIGLQQVVAADGNVHFELMGGPGLAVFDGPLQGDSIGGSFEQGGQAGTFYLNRAEGSEPEAQAESEDLPYAVEEVEFANDTVTLAGTITIPDGAGPHPGVVLITGSGAQNRDEEIFGFKIFRVIADHLTRNGIAVLRYDDRGIGGSSGSVGASTSEDFAADALAGIRVLQARDDIDAANVGLMGHSEGGIVAPIAAAQSDDVAFIVLMAGSAVTGEEILYEQGELILRANGASEEDLAMQRDVQQAMFAAVRGEIEWEEARAKVVDQLRAGLESAPQAQRDAVADTAAFFESRSNAAIQRVQSKWFRFFLDYDPAPVLTRVTVPVLGLFGELDLQVPPDQNAGAMREALSAGGNPHFTIETLPGANHLFQEAITGNPSEYATLEPAFVPGFLEIVTEFILEATARH